MMRGMLPARRTSAVFKQRGNEACPDPPPAPPPGGRGQSKVENIGHHGLFQIETQREITNLARVSSSCSSAQIAVSARR
jgi:hypothetical protein